MFDDEFYELLENEDEEIETQLAQNIYKYNIGDVLIYNQKTNVIDLLNKERCDKENSLNIYGIIIKENNNDTIDIMLRTFLSSTSVSIPLSYYHKNTNNFIAYINQLFERYVSKFKNNITIDIFKFYIPNIVQLDYVNENIDIICETYKKIYGEEKTEEFVNRLYTHGLISQYKNKYYQWLPVKNGKRQINNLQICTPYELLPFFTLRYDFK